MQTLAILLPRLKKSVFLKHEIVFFPQIEVEISHFLRLEFDILILSHHPKSRL